MEHLKQSEVEIANKIIEIIDEVNKMKEKEWALKNYDCSESDYKQSQAIGAWSVLLSLLKEEEYNGSKIHKRNGRLHN